MSYRGSQINNECKWTTMKKITKSIMGNRRFVGGGIFLAAVLSFIVVFWVTSPTPVTAQTGGSGGGSGNENTNCPNYTYSTNVSCPSITNHGAIGPTSFCVQSGDAPPMPSLTNQPGASAGSVVVTTTETCSNIVTYSTNDVSYSFGGLQYNPAPPTSSSPPGTYASDCYITVTSSDTNDCPASPSTIDYGNVTWNILNTNVTTYVKFNPSALEDALDAVEDVAGGANLCQSEQVATNAEA